MRPHTCSMRLSHPCAAMKYYHFKSMLHSHNSDQALAAWNSLVHVLPYSAILSKAFYIRITATRHLQHEIVSSIYRHRILSCQIYGRSCFFLAYVNTYSLSQITVCLHGNIIIWIVMHTYETIWLCLVAPQHDQLQ